MFAGNDRCAVGVLDTLRRAGVAVPGDVSVEAVVARLDGDAHAPPRDVLLDPHLVVRGTTATASP